ncbi:MAG: hypothetical protein IJX70_01500 [Clostridia bacterium]|nr:hypothetical protein [Clostridia bacterium]
MKKFLIALVAIVMVAVCGVLVGCSQVNHLKLVSMGWNAYEKFTYTVYQTEGEAKTEVGTMVYTFKALKGETVNVNGHDYEVKDGAQFTTKLTITAGEYAGEELVAVVLTNGDFSPIVSYKYLTTTDTARAYTVEIVYGGKNTKVTYNGTEKTMNAKSPCYDNDSFYSLIRGSGTMSDSSFSMSFSTVDAANAALRSVSIAMTSNSETVKVPYFKDAQPVDENDTDPTAKAVYSIRATAAASYGSGTSTYLYYAKKPIALDGKYFRHVLLKVVEGNFSYELAGISYNA